MLQLRTIIYESKSSNVLVENQTFFQLQPHKLKQLVNNVLLSLANLVTQPTYYQRRYLAKHANICSLPYTHSCFDFGEMRIKTPYSKFFGMWRNTKLDWPGLRLMNVHIKLQKYRVQLTLLMAHTLFTAIGLMWHACYSFYICLCILRSSQCYEHSVV